jgi:hypothetical protein
MYTVHYRNMQVTALTPEQHEQTCGYWYTVTCGATAHTAFATKTGLRRWLEERGLKLPEALPAKRGEFATMPVIGEYYSTSHGETNPATKSYDDPEFRHLPMIPGDAWHALKPAIITAGLSNARYTLFLITETDGVRTVHHLNPNVESRIEATDHFTMRFLHN